MPAKASAPSSRIEQMKIAVMGPGGIGGYIGARLAEAGEEVHLIARGAHLTAIRRNGLTLKSPHGDTTQSVAATSDPADIGPADVILFTVKLPDAETAAAALAPMVAPDTRIVSLQNGIDSRSILARHVPEPQISAGTIYLAAYIEAPGIIFNPGGGSRMIIDALGGDPVIAGFLAATDHCIALDAEGTDDPRQVLWQKMAGLSALSGSTCLTRLPIRTILEDPEARALHIALYRESMAIAAAEGAPLTDDHLEGMLTFLSNQPREMSSSMLVDLQAGKPLELPWLSGRIHALGQSHAIATPMHTAVWRALHPSSNGSPS